MNGITRGTGLQTSLYSRKWLFLIYTHYEVFPALGVGPRVSGRRLGPCNHPIGAGTVAGRAAVSSTAGRSGETDEDVGLRLRATEHNAQ